MRVIKLSTLLVLFLNSWTSPARAFQEDSVQEPQKLEFRVVNEFPHDTTAFTEGLLFYNKQLFESTGSPNDMPETRSYIGSVDLNTGKVNKKVEMENYFGEGIVFMQGKLFQLTYTEQTCFVYDDKSFRKINEFKYANKEGWGLTTDGRYIIMSDGTANLTYISHNDFTPIKTLKVNDNGKPVTDLNELEYIKGFIYANVWFTNTIVKIDPATGKVVASLDLTSIQEKEKAKNPRLDFLNGIAFDPASDRILVTGKLWSTIYQIDFVH